VPYTVGTAPRSLAVMDYNGDGKLDVAVTAYGASFINVLLGNGDGTFQNGPTFKSGQQPTSVRSADFNGDKKPDLVVTNGGFPLNPPTLQTFVTILLNTPLSFSTTSVTFSNRKVGTTSAGMPVTLTNVGATPVSLMGVTINGADPADFAEKSTTCGISLAAGASCSYNITFTPALTGQRNATLSIADTATTVPQIVLLQGTGQ